MTTNESDGLLVPVDVTAYAIGTLDAAGPARKFAGGTTDYRNQTTSDLPAFLGVNVTRSYDEAPLWPLEQGVHLHWAVPDALTRAETGSGSMSFPPLPNRWLVTRIVGAGASARHWIVLSDALSTQPPGGNAGPTVPVIDGTDRGFRYLGTWEVFDGSWREPRTAPEAHLAALTGYDLHAVATGDIAFAAFYPDARNVLGFHDDLAGVEAPAELTYVVTGWYADGTGDPAAGLTPAQLQAQLGWTVDAPATTTVAYSVYTGIVHGIAWDPDRRYVPDELEPIDGDVALGNHPAETLAAYTRGALHPELPGFEELFTLYLAGLLPDLATPSPGQLAALDETLHELQFTSVAGGTIYVVMLDGDEDTSLPVPIADALNLLNLQQQVADLAALQVTQGKWLLFAAWYRLFEVDPGSLNAAFAAFSAQLDLQGGLAAYAEATASAALDQRTIVEQMMTEGLALTAAPAPRYYAPSEPVVLLAGDAAKVATRYGGDGRYHPDGWLVCRLDTAVLRALQIEATTLDASTYAALAPPAASLPHAVIAALVEEAALLDPTIGGAASGVPAAKLSADLSVWLEGGAAIYYHDPTGTPPSPVEVTAWDDNPWCSLMVLWSVDYHPLLETDTPAGPTDYPTSFFTANYTIDPDRPGRIAYTPTSGGITIDPAKIDFDPTNPASGTQLYRGASVLSPTAADNLRAQVARSLAGGPDPTLQEVAELFAGTAVQLQCLTGFNDALLTQQRSLQLAVGVSPSARQPFRVATREVTDAIPSLSLIPPLAPLFNGAYNPMRAGYYRLSAAVMDPFGRKRPVNIQNLYLADSLATFADGKLIAGTAYAQPRVAQPTRLLFRWIAADATGYDEANPHPATTPVCGWLLPDHLQVGFFLYNAAGAPLGSLTLRDDGAGILWEATPGDASTLGADLATVMAHQNPQLRALALALGDGTPSWFRAFWQAADAAVTQIAPAAGDSQVGVAALVGRPLALVQTSLRLERQGLAALDQSFATLDGGTFAATDRGLGRVELPVVIGDLACLDDGLVGYFKTADGAYDTTTFYSEAATGSDPHVVVPPLTNLLLTPAATPEADPAATRPETRLLLLVDPRAPLHATTAILPTQAISIPSSQYEDALTGLALTYAIGPLLRPVGGLSIPLPAIAGTTWSWITEQLDGTTRSWQVEPQRQPPTAGAIWQYSPQSLTEGWLRLAPDLLRFQLTNTSGTPVVTAGTTTTLRLTITNARPAPITFQPAAIVGETQPKQGSLIYLHFGYLVDPSNVSAIEPSAFGWTFQSLTDPTYGSYWAATPATAPVTLAPGATLTITLANVTIANVAPLRQLQTQVYFDYYNVIGDDDGIDVAVITVQPPT